MSVIKGCLKEESKELKKLVMMYWEVVKKYDAEGKLLPEMILVCVCVCGDASGLLSLPPTCFLSNHCRCSTTMFSEMVALRPRVYVSALRRKAAPRLP